MQLINSRLRLARLACHASTLAYLEERLILPISFRKAAIFAVAAVVLLGLCLPYSALAAGKQTFTGEVGDAMCGRKHMEGTPAECTRTCVKQGSKYALVIDDKIYALDTTDQAVLATLDQQAGKRVTVTGALKGDEIEVSSVAPAK
jgi:hypothetical protein